MKLRPYTCVQVAVKYCNRYYTVTNMQWKGFHPLDTMKASLQGRIVLAWLAPKRPNTAVWMAADRYSLAYL